MSGVQIPHHPPSPLYVLRHGETEWNRAGRMQGSLDSPLTERGRAQAAAMGRVLRREGARALPAFVSPQGRAVRTAELALGPGRATPDERLREIGVGGFEGRLLPELVAEHPFLFSEEGPIEWHYEVPDGEGHDALRARVSAFLAELRTPAVVVCHGITGRMLRGLALGLDRAGAWDLPGGQGVVWRIEDGRHEVLAPD